MNLQLPEGATKRIGKGDIYQMQFSPDDTVLAVMMGQSCSGISLNV